MNSENTEKYFGEPWHNENFYNVGNRPDDVAPDNQTCSLEEHNAVIHGCIG